MASSTTKSADFSRFREKYVMWRHLTSTSQIFKKISESVYFYDILILSKFQVIVIIFDKVMVISRISLVSHNYRGNLLLDCQNDVIDRQWSIQKLYQNVFYVSNLILGVLTNNYSEIFIFQDLVDKKSRGGATSAPLDLNRVKGGGGERVRDSGFRF